MLGFLARRLLATIPVMAIGAVLVYSMLRMTPGDPASIIAGPAATAADVAGIREKLGLDRPIVEQFGIWLGNVLRGDFGESFFFKKTVASLIADRVGPTLALATFTMILSIAVAVPLGVVAAYKQGTWIDRVVMGFSVLGFSVPVFVIGYALIYVFAIELAWLPVQGYQPIREGLWGFVSRLILPSLTLSVIYIALIARITRTSVLEVLGEDYIRTARAKGLSERRIVYRHGLRAAITPVVTLLGIDLGSLLGGAIVTEAVFGLQGIGQTAVVAVTNGDLPVIFGTVLLAAFFVVVGNLLVDLVYAVVDVRVRLS
jgi:peptide/nickel transport system permease protein